MLALASNHLRTYLAPARREGNPSPETMRRREQDAMAKGIVWTVALIGGGVLVHYAYKKKREKDAAAAAATTGG